MRWTRLRSRWCRRAWHVGDPAAVELDLDSAMVMVDCLEWKKRSGATYLAAADMGEELG